MKGHKSKEMKGTSQSPKGHKSNTIIDVCMENNKESRKAIRDLRKMFKWAIKQTFANNEGATLSLNDAFSALSNAWDELHDEGEIVFEKEIDE